MNAGEINYKKCLGYLLLVFLVAFLILAYFLETYHVMFWKTNPTCGVDGQPFYFGSTDVACMRLLRTRHKRSLDTPSFPNRKFWSLNHRWIYYDGWYFELFYRPHTRRAAKSESCAIRRESRPAGYTRLDSNCVRRCALYYNERFIKRYSALTQNCHHYANKLAEVMCTYTSCPDWCLNVSLTLPRLER